jgi:lysophospholipase L1-like esterase
VYGMVSTPSHSTLYRDGWSQTDTALPAGALTGGRLLGSHLAYVYGRADMMGFVLAPGALSESESLGVKSALRSLYDTQSETPTRHVFIQGDSITEGVGAENNITLGRALTDQINDRKTMVRTFGKSGDRMQDSYATFLFASAGSFLEPGARNVLVTWLGTNDLATGRTLGQIQADIRNYVRGASAQGWTKRIYATALPRADLTPERESVRQALNAWIRGNSEGLFDTVWDADALSRAGGVLAGFAVDKALSPDHLHPSEAAYERMAPSLKAVIDAVAPAP